MTQYTLTIEKVNPTWADLDAANVADGTYARKAQPELLVKAERIEKEIRRKIDALFDEAERNGANPWPALYEMNPIEIDALQWLIDLRAYYNGDAGAECDCVLPEQSCRYCKAMAAVSNYKFEED